MAVATETGAVETAGKVAVPVAGIKTAVTGVVNPIMGQNHNNLVKIVISNIERNLIPLALA